jgi:hypothetical protein
MHKRKRSRSKPERVAETFTQGSSRSYERDTERPGSGPLNREHQRHLPLCRMRPALYRRRPGSKAERPSLPPRWTTPWHLDRSGRFRPSAPRGIALRRSLLPLPRRWAYPTESGTAANGVAMTLAAKAVHRTTDPHAIMGAIVLIVASTSGKLLRYHDRAVLRRGRTSSRSTHRQPRSSIGCV